MSVPSPPWPARLVVGAFSADREIFFETLTAMVDVFGPPDAASPWFSFHHTDYYSREMGGALERRLVSFKRLVDQGDLADIKIAANQLEDGWRNPAGGRLINLDPGILTPERFVLATGKNYIHRIYLTKGIYADLTLVYRQGGYEPLSWTYPDYAEDGIRGFLLQLRSGLLAGRRNPARSSGGNDFPVNINHTNE